MSSWWPSHRLRIFGILPIVKGVHTRCGAWSRLDRNASLAIVVFLARARHQTISRRSMTSLLAQTQTNSERIVAQHCLWATAASPSLTDSVAVVFEFASWTRRYPSSVCAWMTHGYAEVDTTNRLICCFWRGRTAAGWSRWTRWARKKPFRRRSCFQHSCHVAPFPYKVASFETMLHTTTTDSVRRW